MSRLTNEELEAMRQATGAHRWIKLIDEILVWRTAYDTLVPYGDRSLDEFVASLTSCYTAWHEAVDLCFRLGMSPTVKDSGKRTVLSFIEAFVKGLFNVEGPIGV